MGIKTIKLRVGEAAATERNLHVKATLFKFQIERCFVCFFSAGIFDFNVILLAGKDNCRSADRQKLPMDC